MRHCKETNARLLSLCFSTALLACIYPLETTHRGFRMPRTCLPALNKTPSLGTEFPNQYTKRENLIDPKSSFINKY